jgi:putative ABC transport system permease protein
MDIFMLDSLIKGIRCLFSNKLRASLTILGIAVGVMSIVIVTTIGEIGRTQINSELTGMGMDSLVVSASVNGITVLDKDDLDTIKSIDSVENAMPLMNMITSSTVREKSSACMVWGVNEDADNVIDLQVLHGRLINKGDIASGSKVCVIDETVALSGYKRSNIVGKKISVVLNGKAEEFEVVGVVKNGVNLLQNMLGDIIPDFVYIPYSVMQDIYSKNSFDQITVKLNSAESSEKTALYIKRLISAEDKADTVSVENLLKQKERMNSIMNIASAALAAVAGISLIVSGISIMTVMLVSVNERTREIGIKKSIGAKNKTIMAEFLIESVMITFIGGILGFLAGAAISVISCLAIGIKPVLNIPMCIAVLIFSIITGAVFGVYPAYKAASMKPVDALRYE